MLEQFTLHIYYPKQYISNKGVNEVCMLEFESNPNVTMRHLPPSKIGLIEHVKGSCYQSGWICPLCHKEDILPDPCLWGWRLTEKDMYRYGKN